MYINSHRSGHEEDEMLLWDSESQRSSLSSSLTQRDGPPKEYEELIQSLEAEVRKHIRIEQQLKLHIESIEYRVEELEAEQLKLTTSHNANSKDLASKYDLIESINKKLEQEIRDGEEKHKLELKSLKERYEAERDYLI